MSILMLLNQTGNEDRLSNGLRETLNDMKGMCNPGGGGGAVTLKIYRVLGMGKTIKVGPYACQHDQLVGISSYRLKIRGFRHGSG